MSQFSWQGYIYLCHASMLLIELLFCTVLIELLGTTAACPWEFFSQFEVTAVSITDDISVAHIASHSKLPPSKNKYFLCVTFRNSPEPVWQCMTMFVDLLWNTSWPQAQTKSKSHHIHLHNSLPNWFWRSLETPLVFISGEPLINWNAGLAASEEWFLQP